MSLRTFIAVPLPADVRRELEALAGEVAGRWEQGAVRWVRPENMHLTLRFLGETEEGKMGALRAGLEEVGGRFAPRQLCLGEMGCFPNARRPRVVWVGLGGEVEYLEKVQRAIEHMVRGLGWEREGRAFRPHLTLGRVRQGARAPRGEWEQAPGALAFCAGELHWIESHLQPEGARYSTLHRVLLSGRA